MSRRDELHDWLFGRVAHNNTFVVVLKIIQLQSQKPSAQCCDLPGQPLLSPQNIYGACLDPSLQE